MSFLFSVGNSGSIVRLFVSIGFTKSVHGQQVTRKPPNSGYYQVQVQSSYDSWAPPRKVERGIGEARM